MEASQENFGFVTSTRELMDDISVMERLFPERRH
jgi:hypothetical protein